MSIIKHMPETKKYGTDRKKLEEFWFEVATSFTENVKAMGFTRKVDAQSLKLVWKQMERNMRKIYHMDATPCDSGKDERYQTSGGRKKEKM